MEFSGYSYHSGKLGSENIKKDSIALIYFLTKVLDFELKNIIVIGRSIGSGPAIFLSSLYTFNSVIVISGFLSIKQIVADRFGLLKFFVNKYFDNEKAIQGNLNKILFIHGKNDEIINYQHSQMLHGYSIEKSKLVLFDDMKHNRFDFMKCVIYPIINFLDEIKTDGNPNDNSKNNFSIINSLFKCRYPISFTEIPPQL